jgi:hypothetical protein
VRYLLTFATAFEGTDQARLVNVKLRNRASEILFRRDMKLVDAKIEGAGPATMSRIGQMAKR